MKVTQSFLLPHKAEKVVEVLCDPDFNVAREKLRDGVISSEFHLLREAENETLFELRSTEYKRKKTGGLDRSAQVQTVTECRYDPRGRRLSWQYRGEGGKMIQLGGVYFVEAKGDQTRFTHEVSIEVKIPIIGKQIAKLIAKEFESRDERYERLWKQYLERVEQ